MCITIPFLQLKTEASPDHSCWANKGAGEPLTLATGQDHLSEQIGRRGCLVQLSLWGDEVGEISDWHQFFTFTSLTGGWIPAMLNELGKFLVTFYTYSLMQGCGSGSAQILQIQGPKKSKKFWYCKAKNKAKNKRNLNNTSLNIENLTFNP